jgi:hypothetical protein
MKLVMRMTFGLAVGLGFASGASAAEPYLVWCNSCTDTQVNDSVLKVSAGLGTIIYVGDTATGAIGTYEVYADVDDSKKPPVHTREVMNAPADPAVTTLITGAIQFYNSTPVGWRKDLSLVYNGSDPDTSGFTVATSGDVQNNFNTWLNATYSGSRGLTKLFGYALTVVSVAKLVDGSAAPAMSTTVTFDDGSKIKGIYNPSTGELQANPDTAQDAEGNPIPYMDSDGKLHKLAGHRHFSDDYQGTRDYQSLLQQLETLRVPVVLAGEPGSAPGSSHPTICVETPNGDGSKTMTCYQG